MRHLLLLAAIVLATRVWAAPTNACWPAFSGSCANIHIPVTPSVPPVGAPFTGKLPTACKQGLLYADGVSNLCVCMTDNTWMCATVATTTTTTTTTVTTSTVTTTTTSTTTTT